MIIPQLKLRRLQTVPITGNFTINCQNNDQFVEIQKFFRTSNVYISYRDLLEIAEDVEEMKRHPYYFLLPYIPYTYGGDIRTKFMIKYESLNQLLKLREVFNIRANRFDMELVFKRNYNPFTDDFFTKCADPVIYKVKK